MNLRHLRRIVWLTCSISLVALGARAQSKVRVLFPVEQNGKWGYIDRTGKIVIPMQFDGANDFHEGLALVTVGKQKQFIDTSGRVVIKPSFDIISDFSEGLAAVNVGQTRIPNLGLIANPGKWGYIDKTGTLAIPMKFTHAEDFSEGLAAVSDGDRSGFIDHTGKIIFDVPLEVTLGFHEGVVGVLKGGGVTYFDRTGRKVPAPSVDYGPSYHSFSEGLAAIANGGKAGFIDASGKLVLAATFEDAEDFSEGLAPVKVRSEETVWCPQDETGARAGFTMKWGYIDKTGKTVIPPQFESAAPFSEGLAEIHQCDQSFFIDKTGKTIISGNFRYASSFSGGLAHVTIPDKNALLEAYIDKNGKIVWGPAK